MSEAPSTQKSSTKLLSIIVGACIAALCVGAYSGMYYQKTNDAKIIQDKDAAIVSLQQQLISKETAATTSQSLGAQQVPKPAVPQPPIALFSLPKDGDRICRGEMLTLSWKANPLRVDEVLVSINSPFPASPLSDTPVSWNETGAIGEGTIDWKIGDATAGNTTMQIPDGELYRIRVDARQNGTAVSKQTSGLFAIDTCKG